MSNHLENSAHGIAGSQNFVDFVFHAVLGLRIGATQNDFRLIAHSLDLVPGNVLVERSRTNRDDVAKHFNAKFAKKQLCEGAHRNPGGRFASRRSLQHVACLREVVLQRAGQIGMARTWRLYCLMFRRIAFRYGKGLLPILPILVLQQYGNRRPDGDSVMNAREDMSPVGFDLHAAAASVALLSAPEVAVKKGLVHSQSRGQSGDECDQGFAVGFSGSEVAQHKQLILTDELPHDRTCAPEN